MNNLYITADIVGLASGGGLVTQQEYNALCAMGGQCVLADRVVLDSFATGGDNPEPWKWDVKGRLFSAAYQEKQPLCLAHFYAGCFSSTIEKLKAAGTKVTYTAAAHDIRVSKKEHERFGLKLPDHLTDPILWARYLSGYAAASVLVCPSTHSANVMREFGCSNRIEIIPHGCELPETVAPLPKRFSVGYLGSFGCDKGVPYLLQAWKQLNLPDAVLRLGGRDSIHPFVQEMVKAFGGGNIELVGWVSKAQDFYDSVTLYIQPSASEGFGCEILEAAASGRAVVCSDGAGAADLIQSGCVVPACDSNALAAVISDAKRFWDFEEMGRQNREMAAGYTWDKIRARYQELWKGLLA